MHGDASALPLHGLDGGVDYLLRVVRRAVEEITGLIEVGDDLDPARPGFRLSGRDFDQLVARGVSLYAEVTTGWSEQAPGVVDAWPAFVRKPLSGVAHGAHVTDYKGPDRQVAAQIGVNQRGTTGREAAIREVECKVNVAVDEAGKHETAGRSEVLATVHGHERDTAIADPEVAWLIAVREESRAQVVRRHDARSAPPIRKQHLRLVD